MKKSVFILLVLLLLLTLSGCGRKEEARPSAPPPAQGDLKASGAYRTFFGEPPAVAEGECYALVGFHPLAEQPGKVTPFPLFLFNRDSQMQAVVEHLLQSSEGWGMAQGAFPRGTEVVALTREKDLVRVELSEEGLSAADPARQRLILAVLGHTLAQFDGVRRVMVVAGGELLPLQAERGFFPDPAEVVPPGPPRVLSVAATWEKRKKVAEEVSVFFDRPVTVEKVDVSIDGQPLAGEYFRSVFDMAVVIKPSDPKSIREGLPVKVAWQAADRLGRKGGGEQTFALKRVEHE